MGYIDCYDFMDTLGFYYFGPFFSVASFLSRVARFLKLGCQVGGIFPIKPPNNVIVFSHPGLLKIRVFRERLS